MQFPVFLYKTEPHLYSNKKPKTAQTVPKPCYGTLRVRVCVWAKQMGAERQRHFNSISPIT